MAFADVLAEQIEVVTARYAQHLLDAGDIAWNKARPIISSMEEPPSEPVDPFPKIAPDSKKQSEVSTILISAIQSSRVTRALEQMKNQLVDMRRAARQHYEEKFGFEMPHEVVRQATGLTESTKNTLDNELGESAFIAHVMSPVEGAFSNHIISRSTIAETMRDMEHRISDRMETFSQVRAFTIMQQYGREVNDLFGMTGARRAEYAGPADIGNREFCAARVGHKFTMEEIKRWPIDNPGTWDGMIPGTNANNIFTNLGGFNCRHILEWEQ